MPPTNDTPELFDKVFSPKAEKRIYTVSEITQDIKILIENTLAEVWVEGEVSNVRPSSAGHYYFSLKDEHALLQAVMFNRAAGAAKFKLEDGQKVVCFGNVEVYPPHGKYQLIIEKIEPKGIGSLQLALEQLKAKLEKEGLFAPSHKRPIPYLPSRIGVVTSLQGAAVKDILKVLDSRFKDVHIVIRPAKVQGELAKDDIAQGIRDLNTYNEDSDAAARIEVMIVGRGGGSIEDLWAFNEEVVARAIYHSTIPVISAVGHERDWTIADLVADVRAATPSVAAELVIPKKEDLSVRVDEFAGDLKKTLQDLVQSLRQAMGDLEHRFFLSMDHVVSGKEEAIKAVFRHLTLLNPVAKIQHCADRISSLTNELCLHVGHFIQMRQAGYRRAVEKLANLSPLNILGRGYSITFTVPHGAIVKDTAVLKSGDVIKTRLHKGEIISKITGVDKDGGDKI